MKRQTTILGVCAVISLGTAGLAAAHGHPPGPPGKPDVAPPTGGHPGHGKGHGHGHGHGHDRPSGHGHGNDS